MLKNLATKNFLRLLFSSQTKAIEAPKKYSETISKARVILPLYKLEPASQGQIFIAPNATVAGQVTIGSKVYIGHGAVIRGDINAVYLYNQVSIGDNCVLHTASSLPSGLSAELEVGPTAVISAGCTLYSCNIGSGVFIGANSVILEGAKLEDGSIILPNSVVPPGRVVPANQVWGGNPIKFVRFAKDQQKFVTKKYIEEIATVSNEYKNQFLPLNNAYLYKPSDPQNDRVRSHHIPTHHEDLISASYDPTNPTI